MAMMAALFLVSLDVFFSVGFLYISQSDFLQVKKRKARVPLDAAAAAVMEPLRRSGRVANLPDKPVYREVGVKGFLFSSKSRKISSFPLTS
jgi:hypothetical protein